MTSLTIYEMALAFLEILLYDITNERYISEMIFLKYIFVLSTLTRGIP
jgi:hypothetical protein